MIAPDRLMPKENYIVGADLMEKERKRLGFLPYVSGPRVRGELDD
jgi:hypothetical protein